MSDTNPAPKTNRATLPFHGINFEDLRSLSTLKRQNNFVQADKNHWEFPIANGTVIFEAGCLLDDSTNSRINAVGVVLDGKVRSSRVLVLEADPYSGYRRGQVVDFDWMKTWRGEYIDYVMTPEQQKDKNDVLAGIKQEETRKRKQRALELAAKRKKKETPADT
jgi:hypothetical protein